MDLHLNAMDLLLDDQIIDQFVMQGSKLKNRKSSITDSYGSSVNQAHYRQQSTFPASNLFGTNPTPMLGDGLGLDSLAGLDMFQFDNDFHTPNANKYVCERCHGSQFASREGGALMICKGCGHILKDHVENLEQEYDHVLNK